VAFSLTVDIILGSAVLIGLGMIFAGSIKSGSHNHKLTIGGLAWTIAALTIWTFVNVFVDHNAGNTLITFTFGVICSFIMYHEWLNYQRKERIYAIDWVLSAGSPIMIVFLLVEHISILAKGIIYATTWLVWYVLNLTGYEPYGSPVSIGHFGTEGGEISLALLNTNSNIVFDCTGFYTMMSIFLCIAFLRLSDKRRYIGLFMATMPVIVLSNLVRNLLLILLNAETNLSWTILHDIIGRLFTLGIWVLIVSVAFYLAPEAFDHLITVMFHLRKRNSDGVRVVAGKIVVPEE